MFITNGNGKSKNMANNKNYNLYSSNNHKKCVSIIVILIIFNRKEYILYKTIISMIIHRANNIACNNNENIS